MIHQQQSNIHSEGSQLSKLFGAHLPKHSGQEHTQFTSDPSNLLMQVLGVQRDGQVNSCQSQKSLVVGNKPANALTLDEVWLKRTSVLVVMINGTSLTSRNSWLLYNSNNLLGNYYHLIV